MVTQRTANPCIPVRFRARPPAAILALEPALGQFLPDSCEFATRTIIRLAARSASVRLTFRARNDSCASNRQIVDAAGIWRVQSRKDEDRPAARLKNGPWAGRDAVRFRACGR